MTVYRNSIFLFSSNTSFNCELVTYLRTCNLGQSICVVGCIILIVSLGLISLFEITELYSTKNCQDLCVLLHRRIVGLREWLTCPRRWCSGWARTHTFSAQGLWDSGTWGPASVGHPGCLSFPLSASLIISCEEPLTFSPAPSLCAF